MTDKVLKLAIYGDSFANPHKSPGACHDEIYGWMHHVAKHFFGDDIYLQYPLNLAESCYNRAVSGSSTWFSYQKFLDDLKNYDNIEQVIFLYSSSSRAPISEEEWAGESYGYYEGSEYPDQIRGLLKSWYLYLHQDQNFLKFIQQSIFDNVNKLCAKHNIKLLNVVPFYDTDETPQNLIERIDLSNTLYSTITGLQRVSLSECGDLFNFFNITENDSWISTEIPNRFDPRFCHLNEHNNHLLAKKMIELMDSRVKRIIHFHDVDGLDFSRESWSKYNTDLSGFDK